MSATRVWLITGGGRGLGRAFTEAALAAGDCVVATVRDLEALDDLAARYSDRLRVIGLDVRERAAAQSAVADAIACFGGIEVVVNNAGYGLVGTVGTMPTFGLYTASKWALEGFSEALAAEVRGFGIRVTIAELGGFDTDWAATSMRFADPLDTYDALRTSLFGTPTVPWDISAAADEATEPGPDIAAAALLEHVNRDAGPLRLLIGDGAPGHVAMALSARRDDYQRDPRFVWPT